MVTVSPTGPDARRIGRADWVAARRGGAAGGAGCAALASRLAPGSCGRSRARRHHPPIATGRLKSRVAAAAAAGRRNSAGWPGRSTRWRTTSRTSLEQQRAFVADASHQLRNPLAALLLRIELLALELPEGNEEIASVRTEGKRLAEVLDDLLDLALAEHAEADLRVTDIGALAAERVAAWRPIAEAKGVRLVRRVPADHRVGRPGHAVQRPGRGDRQRGQVHARGRAVEVTVAARRRRRR